MSKIKDLITPETWTKGCMAIDKEGYSVSPFDTRAISWCLAGWLYKIDTYNYEANKKKVLDYLNDRPNKSRKLGHVHEFNDDLRTTFQDVKAVFEALDI